jgi:ABC-type branched-subunit amino acid transport system ATPase component/ABC-type branched-subunit amino acid transport system permease subunit
MVASDTARVIAEDVHDPDDVLARVKPPIYRGIPYIRVLLILGLILLYRSTRTEGRAQENIFNDWMLYSILVIGFYFVFGISGQFAFSQAAIFGLGAYVSNWATDNPTNPLIYGPIAAVVVCGIIALIFSMIMQRTAHFYFAVGTLALTEIILLFLKKATWFTKGPGGEALGVRPLTIFGNEIDTYYKTFLFLLLILGLTFCFGYLLERSPVRREAIANRDRETVTRTLGLPSLQIRASMFVLGSCIAGLAGSLWAHRSGTLSVEGFSVSLGLAIFLMLILGGMGSMWGALLGAWFYVYVRDYLQRVDTELWGHALGEFWGIIYGGLLIVVMIAVPDGILGVGKRLRRTLRRNNSRPVLPASIRSLLGLGAPQHVTGDDLEAAVNAATPARREAPPIGEPILVARDVRVSFGGVRAVDDVTITLNRHEILGLIGPNGSGKSTFLNAINGVVPAEGHLEVDGAPVHLGEPGRVRRTGILRTYQTPQTYLELTCIENVLLTSPDRQYNGIVASTLLRPLMMRHERARWRHAAEALARVGLLDRAEDSAATLSYGQQRLLELARTIAGDPSILLLDEPSAGLNAAETETLASHLRSLRAEGMSLLVVDHKIDFISNLCDRVVVLELGRLVAEGDPRGIWDDERVVNAYLGVAEEV